MSSKQAYNSEIDILPWYKQFWPWMLIMLPGSVVIACIFTIIISIRYSDDLVVGDYYRAGLGINEQIKKQDLAKKFSIMASFELSNGKYDNLGNLTNAVLSCNLTSNQNIKNHYITLNFRHVTYAHLDKTVILKTKNKTNQYETSYFTLAKGSYHLIVEPSDQEWQLTQRLKQIKSLEGLVIKL
jgi:hypothetical protein